MFRSRMISAVLAGSLVLGSAGVALARNFGDNGYQQFLAGKGGTVITDPSAKKTASTDNPFALYRRHGDPSNAGTPVAASHIATARDDAIAQVDPDPFR